MKTLKSLLANLASDLAQVENLLATAGTVLGGMAALDSRAAVAVRVVGLAAAATASVAALVMNVQKDLK